MNLRGAVLASVALAVLAGVLLGDRNGSAAGGSAASSLAAGGSGSAVKGSTARYGGLPSWLPKPGRHVRRMLAGSPGHPALSIQGEPISVQLAGGGSVIATAVGPEVPEEGRFPVPRTSPVTFVVTFARASGDVPLSVASFLLVDGLGDVHHPAVTTMRGGTPPSRLTAGKPVSLKLRDVLPTGEGAIEWKPGSGRPLAGWDFTVEID
jgi:hypothetical protein